VEWEGALYESMTQADVMSVLDEKNPDHNWQGDKIRAMMLECRDTNKKFIWAIGGWSDLTRTLSDDQIPVFVEKCVELLSKAGDGIDFEWEHLSNNKDIKTQQRCVIGKILPELRKALDKNGMKAKTLSYTTRFNAFWNDSSRPEGATAFPSDGEGVDIANAVKESGAALKNCLDWVNVMMYDVEPRAAGTKGETFDIESYKMVLSYFEKYLPKDKIVMGFEPGVQVAGGIWEGMEVDRQVIDYIKDNGYGGVFFWAINQPAFGSST
jgi:GH18 family chitinase